MKKLFSLQAVVVAGLMAMAPMSQAATVAGTFDVNITLTSACQIAAALPDVNLTYTSFQTTNATGSNSFNITCTNGRPYTVALDSTSVTDDVLNLAYTLALTTASATGNGAAQANGVAVTIASGQSGTCAGATCTNATATNKTRTVTVTY